jgi:hypothetical protein
MASVVENITYSALNVLSGAGIFPPNFSTKFLKNANCGKFNIEGCVEQKAMKSFNFSISSGPIGQDILYSILF